MIAEYSPNIRWGKQHVEVTLMQWGYTKKFTVDVGGNCIGMDVIEGAISLVYDSLPTDPRDSEMAVTVLTNKDGDTLECQDEEGRGEDWVREMVVSVQIVGWTPPTLNEVRKMNGAKPVPDGDRPWQPG